MSTPSNVNISQKAKTRWADPEFRAKMAEKLKVFWADPTNRQRMQKAAKQGWVGRDDRRAIVSAAASLARTGKSLTPEHRAAIKAGVARRSDEDKYHSVATRQKISHANTGRVLTDEQRAKLSAAATAHQASLAAFYAERRAKQSKIKKELRKKDYHPCACNPECTFTVKGKNKLYASGHHPNTASKRGAWHDVPYEGRYGTITMRSSWEVLYALYLDCREVDWKYEPQAFALTIGSKHFTYTPDFYLPTTDEYIEVKGYFSRSNKSLMRAFARQYPDKKISIVFSDTIAEIRATMSAAGA